MNLTETRHEMNRLLVEEAQALSMTPAAVASWLKAEEIRGHIDGCEVKDEEHFRTALRIVESGG